MSIQTTPQTILLKCKGLQGQFHEAKASGALKPGHHVIYNTSTDGEVKKNDLSTGADTACMVAYENYFEGETIDDEYADDDQVFFYQPQSGDELYLRVPAGASAIVEGDRLQVDNTGCVIKRASGTETYIALEDKDNSGGGTEVFIKARKS